jgi:hypothetical protein
MHAKRLLGLAGILALTINLPGSAAPAQVKYSINMIGYVDARFVAGSNLIANPLMATDNAISNLLRAVPVGSTYLPWNPASSQYEPVHEFTSVGGWTPGQTQLRRLDAGFLVLPEARTISFVGEPWPATCVQVRPGFTVTGAVPKYQCGFCVTDCTINWPDVQFIRWDREQQKFVSSDPELEPWWAPSAPSLLPDEAVVFFSFGPQPLMGRSFGYGQVRGLTLLNPERRGADFYFEFSAFEGLSYSVQRSGDLASDRWQTVFSDVTRAAGAYIGVTVPMAGEGGFFRLYSPRLVQPIRTGSQFQFQFHGDQGVQYTVQRSASLETPAWTTVQQMTGTDRTITVTDAEATGPVGYYRLMY